MITPTTSQRRYQKMASERLQKILARAGHGSRRACETLIAAGRLHVNGQLASLGDQADTASDHITLDHNDIDLPEELIYILLNKPRGVESSLAPQTGRKGVRELVDVPGRIYPVGRLDADSEGLMLLTNDGALTNRLTHPRYGHEKEYHVLLDGYPDKRQLATWRRGLILEDGEKTARARVNLIKKGASGSWLRITMSEGRKHQIRRVALALDLRVKRILRVRLSSLHLGRLQTGEWRVLTSAEIARLRFQRPGNVSRHR